MCRRMRIPRMSMPIQEVNCRGWAKRFTAPISVIYGQGKQMFDAFVTSKRLDGFSILRCHRQRLNFLTVRGHDVIQTFQLAY